MRLSLLIFAEIVKLNALEIFCNHEIATLNVRKM